MLPLLSKQNAWDATILMKQISISRAPNAVYQVSDAIIILILGVIAGVRHMSHLAILKTDNVIHRNTRRNL